jgi:hypothetical protein
LSSARNTATGRSPSKQKLSALLPFAPQDAYDLKCSAASAAGASDRVSANAATAGRPNLILIAATG